MMVRDQLIEYAIKRRKELKDGTAERSLKSLAKSILSEDNKEFIVESIIKDNNHIVEKEEPLQKISKEEFLKRMEVKKEW